jgi:hypothetical protein
MCGAGSGLIAAFVTSPLDVMRTRLAVQNTSAAAVAKQTVKYTGLMSMARSIGRIEGIAGFYRGFGSTAFVIPAFWSIYFWYVGFM